MRKLLIIAGCVSLAVCASWAGQAYVAQVSMGGTNAAQVTFPSVIRGQVDTVYLAASTNSAEAVIGITYAPHALAGAAELLGTNSVTGTGSFRPRVTGNAVDGSALEASAVSVVPGEGTNLVSTAILSIPYEPITLSGEPVTVSITGSTTGVTWRAVIVTR